VLTRSGWGAIALAVTSFVIGRVFGIIELFVLGVGIVGALIVAAATMVRRPPAFAVRRLVQPSTVQAGEAARVDLLIANTGSSRSPVVQLWEPVGQRGGATMNLAPLRPGERSATAYRLPTERRGVVRVGPMRARRRDVLGLATRTFSLPGSSELLVMPRHQPVHFSPGGSAGRLGDHLRLRAHGQSGSEFHSLREYVRGDDLRRISWKASARTDELIVKETAPEGLRRCTIVLDTSSTTWHELAPDDAAADDDARADSFERAVSIAASVVTGASQSGLTTRLVARHTDLRGPDVAGLALRWLATVEITDSNSNSNASDIGDNAGGGNGTDDGLASLKAGEGMGLVVVVTAMSSSPMIGRVRSAIGPDDTLIVVTTAPAIEARPTTPATRFVLDASNLDRFASAWASLTGTTGSAPLLPGAPRSSR
jgi:hypothetical protein